MIISKIFKREKPLERAGQIIGWWELRRILFNLLVGLAGVFNCVLMFVILFLDTSAKLRPAPGPVLFFFPIYLFIIFLYGVMANVCYTSGWITEIIALKIFKERASRLGEKLFIGGLVFSILLTLVPAGIFLGIVIFADNGYLLERPDEKDIVGAYYMDEASNTHGFDSKFKFNSDGTFEMDNMPVLMDVNFTYGSGKWKLIDDYGWWQIELCFENPSYDRKSIHLCGSKVPYKIEVREGDDPDAPIYLYLVRRDK